METVHEREVKLAEVIEVSTANAKQTGQELGIPNNVRGLTIIDLAGGASLLTTDLLRRGANAYALDRIYGDIEALQDAVMNGYIPAVLKVLQRAAPHRIILHQQQVAMLQQELREFLKAREEHPERYIEGWLTKLPFSDNFADRTLSHLGISRLSGDYEVLEEATMEGIRITKPGGALVIAPFPIRQDIGTVRMQRDLIGSLESQRLGRCIVESYRYSSPEQRLRIVKAF